MYFMESPHEGERVERKTDRALTLDQLKFAGLVNGATVVDVGCAAGTTTRILAEAVGPSGRVVGVDNSLSRLVEASAQTVGQNVSYRRGLVEHLPCRTAEFDFAWSRFLLEYVADQRRALDEMIRVVRPGGVVCLADLDGNGIWTEPLEADLEAERTEAVATLMRTGFDPHVGRKLYQMACDADLQDVRVDVRPYNVMTGPVHDPHVRDRWERKHSTIEQALCRLGWDTGRAARLTERFRARLDRPGTFSYSVLITVAGIKPPHQTP